MSIISRIASRIAGDSAPVLTLVVGLPGSGKSNVQEDILKMMKYGVELI